MGSILDGFAVYHFPKGPCKLGITANGITLNSTVFSYLGYPERIKILFNAPKRQIAIIGADSSDASSIRIKDHTDPGTVRINRRTLTRLVTDLAGIKEDDLVGHVSSVVGQVKREDETYILFDLLDTETRQTNHGWAKTGH